MYFVLYIYSEFWTGWILFSCLGLILFFLGWYLDFKDNPNAPKTIFLPFINIGPYFNDNCVCSSFVSYVITYWLSSIIKDIILSICAYGGVNLVLFMYLNSCTFKYDLHQCCMFMLQMLQWLFFFGLQRNYQIWFFVQWYSVRSSARISKVEFGDGFDVAFLFDYHGYHYYKNQN